jgi:hypothetical protein
VPLDLAVRRGEQPRERDHLDQSHRGGAGAWTVTELTHEKSGLQSISCPSTSLCVALDSAGDVWTSTDPTGGANQWSSTNITEGSPFGSEAKVSCSSASLCVIAPDRVIKTIKMVQFEADVFASTEPTNGAS